MAEEIINRVANSKLKVIDLEDYYPEGKRVVIDVKDWLFEGLILREKDFRQKLKDHDWEQYQDTFVAISCSSDAIIPTWAFMLLSSYLEPYTRKAVFGNLIALETSIYQDIISNLNIDSFRDMPVIIKGCSKKPVPVNAYLMLTNKLKTIAKSVMFGEACSSVPVYKR